MVCINLSTFCRRQRECIPFLRLSHLPFILSIETTPTCLSNASIATNACRPFFGSPYLIIMHTAICRWLRCAAHTESIFPQLPPNYITGYFWAKSVVESSYFVIWCILLCTMYTRTLLFGDTDWLFVSLGMAQTECRKVYPGSLHCKKCEWPSTHKIMRLQFDTRILCDSIVDAEFCVIFGRLHKCSVSIM